MSREYSGRLFCGGLERRYLTGLPEVYQICFRINGTKEHKARVLGVGKNELQQNSRIRDEQVLVLFKKILRGRDDMILYNVC